MGGQALEGGRVLWEYRVVERRYDAVMEVVGDGRTVTEVAERWGVSRQSLYVWMDRYAAAGLEGLAERSHRPRSCPHQIWVEVEARICELRRRHPGWGPRRLHHELGRDGLGPVPSRSAIYRALVRHRLIEPVTRRRRRADYRRWERDRPMELWQLDVMGGVWLVDGAELKAVTGIDDHSRFCVMAGLVERANARSVCRVFAASLERYGIPDEVLTDNGKVFTGRLGPHPAEVLFDRICRQHGIAHLCTGVRCPTTTARSNASIRPCGPSWSPGNASRAWPLPNRCLIAGWRATTPFARTRRLAWRPQPNGLVPAAPGHRRRPPRP